MSDNTAIEWADATWNPITGCSIVSPGCTNCYAMRLAGGRLRHHPTREGLTVQTKAGPVWNGTVRFNEGVLSHPLRWRKPRRIFVCAHGDLFHEAIQDDWIDQVFAIMARAQQHQFLVLTKRPERMRNYHRHLRDAPEIWFATWGIDTLSCVSVPWRWPNVWLGVSVEDQRSADDRIPVLLDTPAAHRWISAEPMLEPLTYLPGLGEGMLDWVVVGGETGPRARECDIRWIRDIVRACAASETPCFVKQLGGHAVNGDVIWPSFKKGGDMAQWPEDLRVRQWPAGR